MPPKYTMSDSESESDKSTPDVLSDEKLEKGLRDTVGNIYKTGNLDELTVKRVRLATEKALGLDEGFFKGDARWKSKSDEIIKNEVVCASLACLRCDCDIWFLDRIVDRLFLVHYRNYRRVTRKRKERKTTKKRRHRFHLQRRKHRPRRRETRNVGSQKMLPTPGSVARLAHLQNQRSLLLDLATKMENR